MFEFVEVTKSFKEDFWKESKVVLNSLSFKVQEGSLCGFLGANGAGKTTSIKAMLGFISIDKGHIEYSKSMGMGQFDIKSNIGYFPERPYFYPHMTGSEFCHYLGRLQNVPSKKLKTNIDYWAKKLDITFALDKKIKNYSKGMLQRLGFVSALVHDPKLIILDEPLSGLDPVGRKDFKDIMVELNRTGVTVFFSSHIVSDVEQICDSLVVIKSGETFYQGSTRALLETSAKQGFDVLIKSNFDKKILETFGTIDIVFEKNQMIKCHIREDQKNEFINFTAMNGMEIEEIVRSRTSLEKIIYNTGGDDV